MNIKNEENNPKKIYPRIDNAKEIISKECYKKAKEIYGELLPKDIQERLDLELNSILKFNYESIYLIHSELVKYSNELGYEVGYRGCIGNSFVAFLLGITSVNPITYNLAYEFLAGSDYSKEPDIVLNFSYEIQSKLIEYLEKRFGKDKVICCNSFGDLVDCCFIIPNDLEITDICSKKDQEELKKYFYKFYLLSNDTLTLLHNLEVATKVDSNTINFEDEDVLKLIFNANNPRYPINTQGIPEFSTKYVKKLIESSKPTNFDDLVSIIAIAQGTGTWIDNAEDLVKDKGIENVISSRDNIYNYLINNSIEKKIAFEIAEFIRKGKASSKNIKTQELVERQKQWENYKEIILKHNIPEWYIESAEKVKYLFPKGHAIIYTILALKMAWYKVHYPNEFEEKLNEYN